MRSTCLPLACALLFCLAVPGLGEQTYMEITFDDKAVDQPIGTGGATVGEPYYVDPEIEAIVRATPFDSHSLEIHDTTPASNGSVWFSLPGLGVSTGLAVIVMDLWLYDSGIGWEPYCDVYTAANASLTSFRFQSDGRIRISTGGDPVYVPTFPIGRSLPILIALNMDSDTFSAWFDGDQVVTDAPLMLTGTSFGKIWVFTGSNSDAANRFSVDQIRVIDWLPDDIAIEPASWGRIRALYR